MKGLKERLQTKDGEALLRRRDDRYAEGADVNSKTTDGTTALMLAAKKKRYSEVVDLLENTARIKKRGWFYVISDRGGFYMDIFEAVSRSDLAEIERMLANDPRLVSVKGLMGMTPLHMAAIRLKESAARLLLKKGADVNAVKDDGWTLLHNASQNGDAAFVCLLLENGADPNAKSKNGATPLHTAANGISEATVNQFKHEWEVTGAEKRAIDHEATVRRLIAKGAEVNAQEKTYEAAPLLFAIYSGNEGVVRALLENGADANAKDKRGITSLMVASSKGHADIVRLLEAAGAV